MDILLQEVENFYKEGKQFHITNRGSVTEGEFQGKYLTIGEEKIVDFTRLDYLALGSDPNIHQIMSGAIQEMDISCPASQMVMQSSLNRKLEESVADLHGTEGALFFTSGYSVNENIMQALGLRGRTPLLLSYVKEMHLFNSTKNAPTIFFIDTNSHYSLTHGIKIASHLSKQSLCCSHIFATGDYEKLETLLEKAKSKFGDNAVKIIVSDTLDSANGRVSDIKSLYDISKKHNCYLYLDESHAIGALGPQGSGITGEQLAQEKDRSNLMIMGTFTKVFAQLGGYVTFSPAEMSYYLRFCSPQYIFSAPIPPWMMVVIIKTMELLRGTFGEERREMLKNKSAIMRNKLQNVGFDTLGSTTHIVPVLIGDEDLCYKLRNFLLEKGFLVANFQYPAVPRNQAILRFSICVDITEEEIEQIVSVLMEGRDKFYSSKENTCVAFE